MTTKRLLAIICTTAMLMSFSACGEKDNTSLSAYANTTTGAIESQISTTSITTVTNNVQNKSTSDMADEERGESAETSEISDAEKTFATTAATTVTTVATTTAATTTTADPVETEQVEETPAVSIRPEVKEALDSYEAMMDEYCEFMKKYNASPNDMTLLLEYPDYLKKYSEAMDKLSKLEDIEFNDEELKYYVEVTNRVSEKLLDVAL